jgi:hypothetical protein
MRPQPREAYPGVLPLLVCRTGFVAWVRQLGMTMGDALPFSQNAPSPPHFVCASSLYMAALAASMARVAEDKHQMKLQ